MTKDLVGRCAMVTGASSGLGVAFARQLAARGASLVLVARRAERLEALAGELRASSSVDVVVLPADLAAPGAIDRLARELEARALTIDVLINNAGAAVHANFDEASWDKTEAQIRLDVLALVELTHRIVPGMRERGRGHVLNVASIGAYLPCPSYAVYAAAKAFVRNFSEAIAYELAPVGVRVCCLCPGGIATEFFDASGQKVHWWMKLALMSPERCASIGLRALFGRRRVIVSGFSNALGMVLLRLLPRRTMTWIGALVMGKEREARALAA